jgi:hypothetical protein
LRRVSRRSGNSLVPIHRLSQRTRLEHLFIVDQLPFDKPGRFWRGNLHTHSTRSDGARSAGEVVQTYKSEGYDFLALTDHFMERFDYPIVDTRHFRDHSFTTLIGAELHAPSLAHGEPWHLLAVGLPFDFPPPAPDERGPQLAARAIAAGAFLTIAHPAWYSLTLADARTIEKAHAVEIYNHTAHHHNDRGDGGQLVDQLLMSGVRVNIVATDDAHMSTRPDTFGGWVYVKSERLDPDDLLQALKNGHFYASQGPLIEDVTLTDGTLHVTCTSASIIHLTGPGSRSRHARGENRTTAEFPLEPFMGSYCRLTVIDASGRKAWTNPIWLD